MPTDPVATTTPQSAPAPQTKGPLYVGIDVGGTGIKLGIVTPAGDTVVSRSIATQPERGAADAAERCARALAEMATEFQIPAGAVQRVGLATPGPLDLATGTLICPGNLPAWHNSPVRDLFADALGVPVTYANDANAAAWGEFWLGAGAASHSMVMFTLGTGVGGGIVAGDRLLEGANSCGGELGHIIIDCGEDAPTNTMGIRGTLEGYCGSYGIVGQAQRLMAAGEASTLSSTQPLTPLAIAEAAEAGDPLAMRVVTDTARLLAVGVVSVVHTVDPECVVVGGGINFGGAGTPMGDRFLDELRRQCQQRLIPSLRDSIRIDFAELGPAAGYVGAAGLAQRDAQG